MEEIEIEEIALKNGDNEFKCINVGGAFIFMNFKSKKSHSSIQMNKKQCRQLAEFLLKVSEE